MNSATVDLTRDLIARTSITPADDGCQDLLVRRLELAGFTCERMPFGEVTNLWATRRGSSSSPVLAFAGHTDVVPPGPLDQWTSPPFTPTVRDNRLYGRGAADMKTSVAAFVIAAEEFVKAHPLHKGTLALLITSDEEGPSIDGTQKVVEHLAKRGVAIDYCIVGEPTSVDTLGDTIKNGRRGTLSGRLVVRGVQGHVAYPHLAKNPIHEAAPALLELVTTRWDEGNSFYLPTTLQVSNIHAGTGAGNVIPGTLNVDFNLRFSTASTVDSLKSRITSIFERAQLDFSLEWTLGGQPFLTPPGALSAALARAIKQETGVTTELSTTGGTSDGRFIATICTQVVEFGPPNATIHKIDEHVELRFVDPLKNIYLATIKTLLLDPA